MSKRNKPMRVSFSSVLVLAFLAFSISAADTALPEFLQGRQNGAWIASRGAVVRQSALRTSQAIWRPILGDPVDVLKKEGAWTEVAIEGGKEGWVESRYLNTLWILVHKKDKRLMLMDGLVERGAWAIDLGADPEGDKVMSGTLAPGHYRTPEGEMYICRKVPNSRFYKAFLLSYPTIAHAKQGLGKGIINKTQYQAIVTAIKSRDVPPQDTNLGGWVEIHGSGTGGKYDWTLGCIALQNDVIDLIWSQIVPGMPVVVTP